jgi:hypothetical protein
MGLLLPDRPALEAGQFSRQILGEKECIDQIKAANVLKVVFFWPCEAMKVIFAAPGLQIRAQVYLIYLFPSACIY